MERLTTPYDATTTADEVVADLDLTGTRALVTGGAAGIGLEVTRSLARAGAEVVVADRDPERGARVAGSLTEELRGTVRHEPLDLADPASAVALGERWRGELHLLVGNAGIMAVPELRRTPHGWELQLAVNHLGHVALAGALHHALVAAGEARIVSTSSSGHLVAPVDLDDPHFERRPYDAWVAYGQSKTANALFAVGATARWAGDGIVANAVMPGGVMTGLQQHVPAETREEWSRVPGLKTPQQGAATTLVAAVAPQLRGVGGLYLEDGQQAERAADDAEVSGTAGVRDWALDPDAADRLWDASLAMLRDAGVSPGRG